MIRFSKFEFKIFIMICIYILGTFILSLIGPVKYSNYDWIKVFYFLFIIIIFMFFGFYIMSYFHFEKNNHINMTNIIKLINISTIIASLISILLFFNFCKEINFDLSEIIKRLVNIGDTYKNYLHIEDNDVSFIGQLSTLLGFTYYISFCGNIYFISENKLYKKLFYLTFFIYVVILLAERGQIIAVGEYFIIFMIIYYLKSVKNNKKKKLNSKKKIISLIVFFLFFSGFNYIQSSRAKTYNYTVETLSNGYFEYDTEHPIFKIFGNTLGSSISMITFYLSGGYYGLSINMETDFYWTKGYGNSKGLSSYLHQYLGLENTNELAYPYRTENRVAYPADQYWSTVFSWLAGDISFYGIPILFMLLVMLSIKTLRETLYEMNFISLLLFIRLSILFLFVPANNYILQTRGNTITTIFIIFIYIFSKIHWRRHVITKNIKKIDIRSDF